jgi:predicted permease
MSILFFFFRRKQMERDAAEEVESHLQEKAAELEESGMPHELARQRARRDFGNPTIHTEDSRAVWRWQAWDHLRQDLRFACRWMRKSPGFTAIAILSLAVGIGANTAIFSVVKALLLDPLPFRDPGRLTLLWTEDRKRGIHEEGTSWLTVQDWKQRSRSFEDFAICSRGNPVFLSGLQPPERVASEVVSSNLFSLLGSAPVIGRTFTADEEANRNRVVVLSHALWRRLFGGAEDAMGKTLEIDGIRHEVIGVMPRDFFFPDQATEFWRPLTLDPFWDRQRIRRYTDWWRVVGRLKPGVSVAQAQSEMNRIGEQLEREYPTNDPGFAGFDVNVVPVLLQIVGKKMPFLLAVLLGSVAVLLLIACSNLGHLLLARGAVRQHEFAVRRAVGAGRERLVRQLLSESILLAAAGAVSGVILASGALRFLLSIAPAGIPRLHEITIDGGVLLFTAAVSIVGCQDK